MDRIDLSVSIVNYNTRDFTLGLVQSLIDNTHRTNMEILVVDNSSTDGSCEALRMKYPEVKVIASQSNLGFAAATNKVIEASQGRYVVLFTTDTVVSPGAMDTLVEFMDQNPQAGAVGPKILNPDGSIQTSGKTFPTPLVALLVTSGLGRLFKNNRALQEYYLPAHEYEQFREVDQLSGACMLVRRETIDNVGLLDEGFFIYCEDVDWCRRMRQRGWRLYYLPQSSITHYKGESSKKSSDAMIRVYYQSLRHFYHKHYAAERHPLANAFWLLGLRLQQARALLENRLSTDKKVRY